MAAPVIFPLMLIRSAGLPATVLEPVMPERSDAMTAACKAADRLAAARIALESFEQDKENDPETELGKAIMSARRRLRKMQRSGLLLPQPVPAVLAQEKPELAARLNGWNEALAQFQESRHLFEMVHRQSLESRHQWLQGVSNEDALLRSLLCSSHDLLNSLPAFRQTPPDQFRKKDRQTALSLWQYATRAMLKTSPFSRLTTVSAVNWADPEPPSPFDNLKSAVTPNVAILPVFYDVLLRAPAFYRALKIRLNPCITVPNSAGSWEWVYFNGAEESFQQMVVDGVTRLIAGALTDAGGILSFLTFVQSLADAVDADASVLEQYIFNLIDTGFLEWELPVSGLEAGWCGSLYQFLGFLPAEPVIVETAALLQWLRTAARTLQFQSLAEAQALQRETLLQLKTYCAQYEAQWPDIPVEHVFFEDVTQPAEFDVPADFIRTACQSLMDFQHQRPQHRLPTLKASLHQAAAQLLQPGESMDFLAFCRAFLSNPRTDTVVTAPANTGKIGLVAQFFQEDGQWRAVLNGLYPGGGKLFARWLHLFPDYVRERVGDWLNVGDPIAFPWQGWSNVNFQPVKTKKGLQVPGGRQGSAASISLGAIKVRQDAGGPVLARDGQILNMTDLGLEAPSTRPPVMQILWSLGVPYVSVDTFWPEGRVRQPMSDHWHYLPRVEQGVWVLARAAWEMDGDLASRLSALPEVDFYLEASAAMDKAAVPKRFFARIKGQKPQYVDREDALSMQSFRKMLQANDQNCLLEELLPNWQPGQQVHEIILEISG